MATSAAMMTRSNFANLLTPIHKKIFFDSYNEVPSVYRKLFSVEKMNAKSQTYPHLGALGLWAENTEGSTFNHDKFDQGPIASFEAKRFDKAYELTWELVQDDLYNVMKGLGKGGSAKGLGRGLRATEETESATVLSNGFSNVGYDGKALFAEDHPLINSSSNCSNVIHAALTDANLKNAMTLMRQQLDEAGIVIQASAKRLIVSPENEFVAKAIVNSILQSGTNYNDVNTVPNLEIVVWDFLTGPAWFLQDPTFDNLKFLRREEPIFDSERIQDQMDYRMFGYTRFDVGYVDWRGLVGSTGTTETLGTLTPTIAAGSSSTKTKVTAVTGKGTGTLKYKVGSSVDAATLNESGSGYTALTLNTEITCASGNKIVIVEVDGNNKVKKASTVADVVVGA